MFQKGTDSSSLQSPPLPNAPFLPAGTFLPSPQGPVLSSLLLKEDSPTSLSQETTHAISPPLHPGPVLTGSVALITGEASMWLRPAQLEAA